MKIYKYTTRDAAIKILSKGTLQFSIYDALNDPFEFMLKDPPSMGGGESVHYREALASGLMLCSFSATSPFDESGILLCSHYSEGHRGVVLQFDSKKLSEGLISSQSAKQLSSDKIIPGVLYKVHYRKRLLHVKNYEAYSFAKGPLLRKAWVWNYEKEYRLFGQIDSYWKYQLPKNYFTQLGRHYLSGNSKKVRNGRLCFPFPKEALECVWFGCQPDINYDSALRDKIYKLIKRYPKCGYEHLGASWDRYGLTMSV